MKKLLIILLAVFSLSTKAQCFTYNSIIESSNPCAVCSADFNGDGFKDIASANHSFNNVAISFGNGLGSFVLDSSFAVGSEPH